MLITEFQCELCERSIPESKQAMSMTVDIRCGQTVAYDGCYRDGTHVCPFCADVIYERRKSIRGQEVQNPCKEVASPNWVRCAIGCEGLNSHWRFKVDLETESFGDSIDAQSLRYANGQYVEVGYQYHGQGYVKVHVIDVMPRDFLRVEFPNKFIVCVPRSKMKFFRD